MLLHSRYFSYQWHESVSRRSRVTHGRSSEMENWQKTLSCDACPGFGWRRGSACCPALRILIMELYKIARCFLYPPSPRPHMPIYGMPAETPCLPRPHRASYHKVISFVPSTHISSCAARTRSLNFELTRLHTHERTLSGHFEGNKCYRI